MNVKPPTSDTLNISGRAIELGVDNNTLEIEDTTDTQTGTTTHTLKTKPLTFTGQNIDVSTSGLNTTINLRLDSTQFRYDVFDGL